MSVNICWWVYVSMLEFLAVTVFHNFILKDIEICCGLLVNDHQISLEPGELGPCNMSCLESGGRYHRDRLSKESPLTNDFSEVGSTTNQILYAFMPAFSTDICCQVLSFFSNWLRDDHSGKYGKRVHGFHGFRAVEIEMQPHVCLWWVAMSHPSLLVLFDWDTMVIRSTMILAYKT